MLKELENRIRAAVLRAVVAAAGGGPAPPLPRWGERPHRVLVIRDDGIGDFIVSIEVLRAIADVPGVTLDVVCSPANAQVARTLPFINEVIVHRRGSLLRSIPVWHRLRRARYAAVVDARVSVRNVNVQTTALLLATGARWRIGLAGRGNDRVYTVKIPERDHPHWVDQVVALAAPLGIAPDARDWRPRIPVPDESRAAAERAWSDVGGHPRVLVNLSVGHPERWWPPERYGPVLRRIRDRLPKAAIMVVGMPEEMPIAEGVARAVGGCAVRLSLPEVLAVVQAADLLVSPDTAVTHAASGFETPTIALQRRGTHRWSPYRTPGRTVFSDDPRAIRDLPADRVVQAVDAVIDELGSARGWT